MNVTNHRLPVWRECSTRAPLQPALLVGGLRWPVPRQLLQHRMSPVHLHRRTSHPHQWPLPLRRCHLQPFPYFSKGQLVLRWLSYINTKLNIAQDSLPASPGFFPFFLPLDFVAVMPDQGQHELHVSQFTQTCRRWNSEALPNLNCQHLPIFFFHLGSAERVLRPCPEGINAIRGRIKVFPVWRGTRFNIS